MARAQLDARPIARNACTSCGHSPHDAGACPASIRTATNPADPCPCTAGPTRKATP